MGFALKTDNINLVPTEKRCPGDQSFQYEPSVCASAKVDSNCNEQKESDHSEETERGDPANPLASNAIVCSEKRSFVGDTSVNPERSSKIARVDPCSEQNSAFMRLSKDKVGVQDHSELPLSLSDKPHDSDSGGKWLSEDDLCSAFEKDPELCWNAICALYRQQISENKSSYSMSQLDEMRFECLNYSMGRQQRECQKQDLDLVHAVK